MTDRKISLELVGGSITILPLSYLEKFTVVPDWRSGSHKDDIVLLRSNYAFLTPSEAYRGCKTIEEVIITSDLLARSKDNEN